MSDRSKPIPGLGLILWVMAGGLVLTSYLALTRSEERRPAPQASVATGRTAQWPALRIDLNRAPEAELTLLPGIGPVLALRIVEDRQRNGPFDSVDSLQRVSGIGPRTLENLRDIAIVDRPDQ